MLPTDEIELIRAEYGQWTAHNIELRDGLFTMAPSPPDRAHQRADLYRGLAKTFLRRGLRGLKVLDLGCLEGGISLFLARHGARCTGVDVRSSHLVKASFASKMMGLSRRCQWIEADVTDSSLWGKIGRFDLVICSGLLYHLDAVDLVPLLRHMQKACRSNGLAVVDTNIAPAPLVCARLPDQPPLWGCQWKEHDPKSDLKERLAANWSSYQNNQAFWLTERSLTNALVSAGFGTVFKALYPYHEWGHQTRDIWLAFPGKSDPAGLPLRDDPDPRPWAHPGIS